MADKELFDELDSLIRQGQLSKVRVALKEILRKKKHQRADLVRLANLARRAGMPEQSVRLLNPIVRPGKKLMAEAKGTEKAEYAVSLLEIGARTEGFQILREINPSQLPEVLLFESFGLFFQWSYAEALPLLRKYIMAAPNEYQRLVGKVNLAAAVVALRHKEEAESLLAEIREATAERYPILFGYSLELSGQTAFGQRQYKKARDFFGQAAEQMKRNGSLNEFFVRKWQAFITLAEGDREALKRIQTIKNEAAERRHWETARDCDFQVAVFKQDESLFNKLFHGTPFEGFRQRIRAELSSDASISSGYLWKLMGDRAPSAIFDLAAGEEIGGSARLKVGQLLLKLLQTLCSDFYAPFRIARFHSLIFPEDFYNPITSPLRVHQLFDRFKKWCQDSDVPLGIEEDVGSYRLIARKPYAVRTSMSLQVKSPVEILLEKHLGATARNSEFTTKELALASGKSIRTVHRLLKKALDEDRILILGQGSEARYRLK